MAIRNPARRCPRCLSEGIRELFRIEAGELPGFDEDAAVYTCHACGHEWDSEMTGGRDGAVVYTTSHRDNAAGFFGPLADLYAVVYAEPPYEEGPEQVARFRDGLPEEAERPGFTLVTAAEDFSFIGAAYGWTMPAGSWWQRADTDPPAHLRDVDKLAVMEWIVHPHRRGEGIGSELMRRLLTDRPETYATLASNPRSVARSMYARAGWQQVAGSTLPWDDTHMDLLILPLPAPVEHR